METWVHTLLSLSLLMSYPLLTAGRPFQQVSAAIQVHSLLTVCLLMSYPLLTAGRPFQQVSAALQERDQCEFDRFQKYEEQCGTETITLSPCNPGQRRVWWCVQRTGLPDDFNPDNNVLICGGCPPNTFRKSYNKCGTCHRCTECGEGETMEEECEMEQDTKCAKVLTQTSAMVPFAPPYQEATPSSTPHLQLSTKPLSADGTTLGTMTPNQVDIPREPPVELPKATPHTTTDLIYLAVIVIMAVLLIGVSVCYCRERLLRKKAEANLMHGIPLNGVNNNGDTHRGDNDGEPRECEEQAPLLVEGCPGEEDNIGRDPVDGDAVPAIGHPVGDGCTGIQLTEGSPDDDVADLEVDDGTSGSASDDEDDGLSHGAHDFPADVEEHGASAIPDHTEGANCDAGATSSGLVVDIPEGTPVGVHASDGAASDPSGDLAASKFTSDAGPSSAGSNGCTDGAKSDCAGANSNGAASSSGVDFMDTPNEAAVDSNDGAIGGTCGAHTPPIAALEEIETNASGDGNAASGGSDGTNSGAEAFDGGVDELVDERTHDAPASAVGSACGHRSSGAGDDDRRTDTIPEQINPGVQADDVVTTRFLAHVAQQVPHVQVKKICRMLGLEERDIDDIEVLKIGEEHGFEFLKKLLGHIGKDLTYRCLIQAMNKSKNKHYADYLIRDFDILL